MKYVFWGAIVTGIVFTSVWWLLSSRDLHVAKWIIGAIFSTLGGSSFGFVLWYRRNKPERNSIDQANYQARHDQLTNLLNRAGLMEELDTSLLDAKANRMVLGVLFLDLDRFKVINDSMGHETGDKLLQIVAERLKASVRNTDLVARFGGDEFVVVCRGLLSRESVVSVAKEILKNFSKPTSLNGRNQMVSTSIGVSIFSDADTRTSEELVRDADTAMFKAKRSKSGFAVFDKAQHQQNVERLEIERGLSGALQENQFQVYYQPIVDMQTQKLYAFEALVRWNHPTRGIVGPNDFLAVAEEAGMLARIGDIVLREACAQASMWNHLAEGARDVKMNVNLAEQQLLDPNLKFHIADILTWAGIEPQQLVLEITEDVIVDHLDGLDSLRHLREMGVSLAIDDFGTGQSSLNSIKQLDMVSTLKIDKKFVHDMDTSEADKAIIEAIVAMAKALDMNIVAEGVETEEQIFALQNMGVEHMQGFFFSKPKAAETVDPSQWFQKKVAQD